MESRTRHLRGVAASNPKRFNGEDGDDKRNSATEWTHHHGRAGSNGGCQGRGAPSGGNKMSPGLSGTKDMVLPSSSRPVVQLLVMKLWNCQ